MTDEYRKKVSLQTLAKKAASQDLIIGMECHEAPSAMMAEALGMDILCCSSPGPTSLMGHRSAATADFDELLYMFRAVLRGAHSPFRICNLPNTTACISVAEAVRNAGRVMALGGDGVHIEPTQGMLPKVQAIADAGIPVVGHFGVGDRSLLEGFLPRGRCADDAHRLVDLIEAAIDAGVVMVLLEHVSEELSRWCWQNLPVPVLSLGSGPYAHGQFHVSSDIIGCSATPVPPKRQAFANVWGVMQEAYTAYMEAARSGAFPQSDHVHRMRGDEHERFLALMETRDRRG